MQRSTPEPDVSEKDDVEILLNELVNILSLCFSFFIGLKQLKLKIILINSFKSHSHSQEQNLDAAALSRRSDLMQVPELADYLKYMKYEINIT